MEVFLLIMSMQDMQKKQPGVFGKVLLNANDAAFTIWEMRKSNPMQRVTGRLYLADLEKVALEEVPLPELKFEIPKLEEAKKTEPEPPEISKPEPDIKQEESKS